MAQITPDKPPKTMKPCETAVEVSTRRRFGFGGNKATLYSCNFTLNVHERGKTWLLRDIK